MKFKRLVVIPFVSVVAVLALAAPSFAGTGSFPWTASFKAGLDSRTWTQIGGSTKISAKLSCDPNTSIYYIELYQNKTLADKSYGRVKFDCGVTEQYTWTSLPGANYHFHISKANDGVTISGSGTVTYPSS